MQKIKDDYYVYMHIFPNNKKYIGISHLIQYDKNNNFINEFYGITEANNQTKINISNISQCASGKRKSAGGYIWRFKEVM